MNRNSMTIRFAGVAIALLLASPAIARDVAIPGGRVTHFSDPPTETDLARAGSTAASLLVYHSICGQLSTRSLVFVADLVGVAGAVRVESFIGDASSFALRNGTAGYCYWVRTTLPAEVFAP